MTCSSKCQDFRAGYGKAGNTGMNGGKKARTTPSSGGGYLSLQDVEPKIRLE